MDHRVIILLAAQAVFALSLINRAALIKTPAAFFLSLVLLAGAFVLRGALFDYETLDYQNFLAAWVDFFRSSGGFAALKYPIGNYNIPYLYFLALFSYSGIKDLYLIKLLSVFFDVVLAYSAAVLAGHITQSTRSRLALFFAVLYLPTVVLNGALWGQCDSIYTALALLGLCCALDDRPVLSVLCIALSFGFKLQAVFIMPVYAVLWINGKVRLRHLLLFPVFYMLLVLPAVLLGRPAAETLLLYFDQAGSIGSGLNYNSPSVFAVITNVADTAAASRLGIGCAFMLVLAVLGTCLALRRRLSVRSVIAAAFIFAVGIPFLLPHMHDRYFFCADILSLVAAFAVPELAAGAVCVQFASLLGYHAYLKMRYFLPMRFGSAALIIAFACALILFISGLSDSAGEKIFQKSKI